MPPEVSHWYPLVTQTSLLTPFSAKSKHHSIPSHKYCWGTRKMNVAKKKLIPVLFCLLLGFSILRIFNISIMGVSWSPKTSLPMTVPQACSSSSPTCNQIPVSESPPISSADASPPTRKELKLLLDLISRRAPCNILVFGIERQYMKLLPLNAGGTTIFLEDDSEKLSIIKTNSSSTRVYKVKYQTFAKEAYKLLNNARKSSYCSSQIWKLQKSKCKLALKKLPQEVYNLNWDVIVVDGPNGDGPDTPGRMATIYTASILARAGNRTDVFVHDVDRMIEKWFSWEFLCDNNLVSSKGKLWNFRIARQSNSSTFCPT